MHIKAEEHPHHDFGHWLGLSFGPVSWGDCAGAKKKQKSPLLNDTSPKTNVPFFL